MSFPSCLYIEINTSQIKIIHNIVHYKNLLPGLEPNFQHNKRLCEEYLNSYNKVIYRVSNNKRDSSSTHRKNINLKPFIFFMEFKAFILVLSPILVLSKFQYLNWIRSTTLSTYIETLPKNDRYCFYEAKWTKLWLPTPTTIPLFQYEFLVSKESQVKCILPSSSNTIDTPKQL